MAASPERKAITYVATCHGLLHVLELAYGVVLVSVAADMGATLLTLGIIANIFGFAYGLTALPVGILADRTSETRLLSICALGMGAASIGVSLSQGTVSLGIALAILGVALGLFHPVATAYVARIATKTGLGFAYLGTGGNLGLALGPIMIGALASGFGWRYAYAGFAVPCLILGFLIMRLPSRSVVIGVRPGAVAAAQQTPLRPFLLPLGLIFAANTLNGLLYRGVVTFLPSHLSASVNSSIAGIDPVLLGGSFTTVALLFGVAGQFLGGFFCDRRRREAIALIAIGISAPALLGVWGFSGPLLLGFAALFAFFHFMSQPVFNALIADYCPDRWRGRMYGVYFFFSFGVGSFSASGLGYVADTQGVQNVFLVCAFLGLAALIFVIALLVRAVKHGKRRNTCGAA